MLKRFMSLWAVNTVVNGQFSVWWTEHRHCTIIKKCCSLVLIKCSQALLRKCASAYISAKLQKCTFTMHIIHSSFQLKWRLVAVKHQQPLSHKLQVQGRLLINKDLFCVFPCTAICFVLKTLFTYISVHDLKKNTSDFASHNRLHVYGFSDVVNLPVSSPGTALHYKSHETWVTSHPTK